MEDRVTTATLKAIIIDVQAMVRQRADTNEITTTISRLGRALDAQEWDEFGSIFAEDATAIFAAGKFEGLTAITDYGREAHKSFAVLQHVITDHIVELDADKASAKANLVCYAVATDWQPDKQMPFMIGGYYKIELTRTPQGWRIVHLVLDYLWSNGAVKWNDSPAVQ